MTEHPKTTYERLRSAGGRSVKLETLEKIQLLCIELFEAGERDFSLASMSHRLAGRNIIGRAIYNPPSAAYRELLDAWRRHAGPVPAKEKVPPSEQAALLRIPDPAIRAWVQTIIIERTKFRRERDTLLKNNSFVLDRRPKLANQGALERGAPLTPQERSALEAAISPAFFSQFGWEEAPYGEVVQRNGRTVFQPGFITGLRKLLGIEPS